MKYHFYCFSFLETNQDNASTIFGIDKPAVNQSALLKARSHAGVSAEAVVLGITYLGHMTEEEFNA